MTDTLFCYHCRKHHPKSEMTLLQARGCKRWRCRKSLVYVRNSRAERDAFGQTVSATNQMLNALRQERPLPHPVLELLRGGTTQGEGLA